MRITDVRFPRKALLLICEGQNTEPNFFNNFRFHEDCTVFDILPEPRFSSADLETHSNRGDHKRVRRQLGGGVVTDEPIFPGVPPMSWINAAEQKFDTYEEIWCIFDKDDHPSCKEAFEKVKDIQSEGKNLRIAFSSISIEYYFLLHFEYLYNSFSKSECKVSRKKKANCLLEDAVEGYACNGDKCVNGYARLKGYWQESKSQDNAIYPLVKDKLFIGIRNAVLLRRESDAKESEKPFYERNPYTTVDYLVARLLGVVILDGSCSYLLKVDATMIEISRNDKEIEIKNCGGTSLVLNKDLLSSYDEKLEIKCTTKLLQPNEIITVDLPGPQGSIFFINGSREKLLLVK